MAFRDVRNGSHADFSFGWKADVHSRYIARMNGDEATMLQFDWEAVEGKTITSVIAQGARGLNDGSLEGEQIALVLGDSAVVIRVNANTDEVIVSLERLPLKSATWQTLHPLEEMVSRSLGWCWIGRNYRGYLDTFTLGVDGIYPAYSFSSVASSLQCARVMPIAA